MTNLLKFRKQIDKLDQEILSRIEARIQIAKQIAEIKKENKIPTRNKQRENEIHQFWQEKNTTCSPNFITKLLNLLLKESRDQQIKIIKQNSK
jgi:chorismate mutase